MSALLNLKVACLFFDFGGHLFYMNIKEETNGTVRWVSSDNDGVNELAVNPLAEESDKERVTQEVKCGCLRLMQGQNLQKISKQRVFSMDCSLCVAQ